MSNNYKTSISAILVAFLFFCFGEVFAQNFTNNTNGTYNAAPEGVIKMKTVGGTFNGTAALGSATSRVQGTVDWAATANDQAVQVLYYTNLTATGGTKTIADGIHVGGVGSSTPLPAYSNMTAGVGYYPTSGNRTYSGTFFYDSTADQLIFAENGGTAGTNRYNNLDMSQGKKTTAGNITQDGALTVHNDATMFNSFAYALGAGASLIQGNFTNSFDGTNPSSFTTTGSGTVNVNSNAIFLVDGGTLAMQSTGHFTIESDGSLTLATGTNGDGKLAMDANSYLDDAGKFTNTATNHANMTFDALSTVQYSGATDGQNLVATVNTDPTNKYATLIFTGAGTKVLEATALANVYTRGNVTIQGGNVVITSTNNNDETKSFYTDATGGNKITFPDQADLPYIQGNVVLDGTISADAAYTLNNYETQITFKTVPTTFGFNVQSGVRPPNGNDFDATHDVSRSIFANFDGNATGTIIKNLRVGYSTADLIGGFNADQSLMRYVEGYDANQPMQKITGGKGIATNSGTTPATTHWVNLVTNETDAVELIAAAGGGTIRQVSDKSNIILSATPLMFIAVNNGRWTNPNTWDEGIYPSSTDNALIRALVYTGMNGAYGTGLTGNETSEQDVYVTNKGGDPRTFNGALAHSITIDLDPTPADDKPYALAIGNSDITDASSNPSNFLFKTEMSGTIGGFVAGLYNNNNAGTNTGNWNNESETPAASRLFGLFVTNIGNSATNTSTFGVPQLVNAGVVTNHSVIEIGN